MLGNFIALYIRLVLLLTPFFVLSVFITMCAGMERAAQRKLAFRVGLAVCITTAILYLFGELLFRYLGISLNAFRIGAGLVLMLSGIDMVRGGLPKNRILEPGNDPAVVPLAIPTTVGPGTIGTMLLMGASVESWGNRIFELCAILLAGATIGVMLYFSEKLGKVLKDQGLSILSKLTGMYIVALAAEIIFTGIHNMLK